jgi:hypothetical protein
MVNHVKVSVWFDLYCFVVFAIAFLSAFVVIVIDATFFLFSHYMFNFLYIIIYDTPHVHYIIDIDECADDSDNECHPNSSCINIEGSYDCSCLHGYTGDGRNCLGKRKKCK